MLLSAVELNTKQESQGKKMEGGRKWQSDTSLNFSCLLIKTERRRASEREAGVVVQRDRQPTGFPPLINAALLAIPALCTIPVKPGNGFC